MDKCENFSGIISADDIERQVTYLANVRCKMWTCGFCAWKNAAVWRAHIIDTINRLDDPLRQWTFATLTSHRKMRGPDASLKCIREGWKKLYDRIKRKYGKSRKVEYIRVWEKHADGSYHCHVIFSCHVKKKWLKNNAAECGMGYMADVQLITGHAGRVAAYITKYMTKALDAFPSGFRRVQGSRAFSLRKTAENALDWRFMGNYTLVDAAQDFSKGHEVYHLTEKRNITYDDFIDGFSLGGTRIE